MTTAQSFYGKGGFAGRVQGVIDTLLVGIAVALLWTNYKKKRNKW